MLIKLHSRPIMLALLAAVHAARAQSPVISSFSQNGVLTCANLQTGSVASVEWASSVSGPWQSNWTGLTALAVGASGSISVGVPMFYRVRGMAAGTNPPVTTTNGMVLIPAGSFAMGDSFNDSLASYGERPVHTVQVSSFYMDKYEVTKALWDDVYSWAITNGYTFVDSKSGQGKAANHPVQTVAWYDSVVWCNARSEKDGLVPAYYTDAALTTVYRSGQVIVDNSWVKWDAGYRLPTEAEWEKAARGGAGGRRFPWSDVDTITQSRANYSSYWSFGVPAYSYDLNLTEGYGNWQAGGTPYTSPVGSFAPNGYGLYDMAGNVWEWCWDWFSSPYYASSPGTDPRGPTGVLSYRVKRGGEWPSYAYSARCASRDKDNPNYAIVPYGVGFRCVRGL